MEHLEGHRLHHADSFQLLVTFHKNKGELLDETRYALIIDGGSSSIAAAMTGADEGQGACVGSQRTSSARSSLPVRAAITQTAALRCFIQRSMSLSCLGSK